MEGLSYNTVPTRVNLFRRRLVSSSLCLICNQQNKTIEHILLLCPWTTSVWFGLALQLLPTADNMERLDKWICKVIDAMKVNTKFLHQRLGLLATLLQEIWKGRNEYLFSNKKPEPMVTLNKAILLSKEYFLSSLKIKGANPSGPHHLRSHWWPAPASFLKCNVDTAFS